MISPRLAGAMLIQAMSFLGPLAAAPMGLLSGESTGVVAPLLWFFLGIPLSYRVLDRRPASSRVAPSRRKVLRPVRL
jgi:hypothetical protein